MYILPLLNFLVQDYITWRCVADLLDSTKDTKLNLSNKIWGVILLQKSSRTHNINEN